MRNLGPCYGFTEKTILLRIDQDPFEHIALDAGSRKS